MEESMDLTDYGFSPQKDDQEPEKTYARVAAVHKARYQLIAPFGECHARLKAGVYFSIRADEFPTTGDFVEIQRNETGDSLITRTLPRKSVFTRNDLSGHAEAYVKTIKAQMVAANFDYVFILQSLNHDFSLRRLERYLAQAWQSGALPVVVLTKADLAGEYASFLSRAETAAAGAPIHVVSAKTGEGLSGLSGYLEKGKTIVLLGSSGVGKSSLVNALAGRDVMAVRAVREDDSKGRHTTTHRQLIVLDSGAMIIDTPGMRELGMWDASQGLCEGFADVEELIALCRFTDCKHHGEPGCAIEEAVESGRLSSGRWEGYLALKKELAFVKRKAGRQRAEESRGAANRIRPRKGAEGMEGLHGTDSV
jgi:ribosome biogenesis GTPase